jgi:ubiquinol-cytochrome c reductase cytochrome b subunit/menaquinol-cytochrome c reductase cytochrome b/c subunit
VGENGNDGPGPELTDIADRLPAAGIQRTLINPTSPMPSFKSLQQKSPEKFRDLVAFLGRLKKSEGATKQGRPAGS